MYVLFPVSQADISHARNSGLDIEAIKVTLRFADGKTYGPVGKIDFVDVTVNRATDTVQVRAVFPNPSGALIDGQLWEVNLEAGKPEEQVVVPQAAMLTDQQGVYVFVVEVKTVCMVVLLTKSPTEIVRPTKLTSLNV